MNSFIEVFKSWWGMIDICYDIIVTLLFNETHVFIILSLEQ